MIIDIAVDKFWIKRCIIFKNVIIFLYLFRCFFDILLLIYIMHFLLREDVIQIQKRGWKLLFLEYITINWYWYYIIDTIDIFNTIDIIDVIDSIATIDITDAINIFDINDTIDIIDTIDITHIIDNDIKLFTTANSLYYRLIAVVITC